MVEILSVVLSALIVVMALYILKTYNLLIKLRINVNRQASHVQVHQKQKFDMIPALVDIVKGYTKHEKGLLEEVTRLRSQWGSSNEISEQIKTSNLLESALSKLLLVQERYPKIKADKGFIDIQKN